jgi:hypothetical protein
MVEIYMLFHFDLDHGGVLTDRDASSRGSGKPVLLFDARRVLLLCFTQHVQNLI